MTSRYEGTGPTIDEALREAHMQIPDRDGRDFTVSRVVDWGMQSGGITDVELFYVAVEEDPDAPPRT